MYCVICTRRNYWFSCRTKFLFGKQLNISVDSNEMWLVVLRERLQVLVSVSHLFWGLTEVMWSDRSVADSLLSWSR